MLTRRLAHVLPFLALLALASPAQAQTLGGVSGLVHGQTLSMPAAPMSSAPPPRAVGAPTSSAYGLGPRPSRGPLAYPYRMGNVGTAWLELPQGERGAAGPSVVVGLLDLGLGYVLDDVARARLSARFRIVGLVELEARYEGYLEPTDAPIHGLGIARLALGIALVRDDRLQIRTGLAGLLYHDLHGVAVGGASTLELDAYPIQPMTLHAELGAGSLGQALMVEARGTLGAQIDRTELYAGYQVLFVESGGGASVTLHGPIVGACLWIS